MKKKINDLISVGLLAAIALVVVATLGLASWGCYPKNCDPKTDPLKCQCPPGPCGDMPSAKPSDAGADQ